MDTDNDEATIPGLAPVVHEIYVAVAAETTQAIPSIITEIADADEPNPVPVKVMGVFPVTVPYLGLIAVIFGVDAPTY